MSRLDEPVRAVCKKCGASLSGAATHGLCAKCFFARMMVPADEAPRPERLASGARFGDYELLETIRLVLDKEPRRPSLIQPGVDRDLETICLKCLEKDSSRRYGSAEALADDLERWLRDEPIVARPASLIERTVKWVRRRPQLAAFVALAAIAPLAIITVLAVSNFHIRAARQVIAAKAEESRQRVIQLNVAAGVGR
jgi:eukaryotic-like serine/threonine-protein kinase